MGTIGNSILRYSFSKPFKIEMVHGKEDCVLNNSEDLVCYINGSKTRKVLVLGLKCFIPFEQYATVLQAEVMTINNHVQENMKQAFKKTQIHIYKDSQTMITLGGTNIKCNLVW